MANNVPYGFLDLQTLQAKQQKVIDTSQVIMDAVDTSVMEHNLAINGALTALTVQTTKLQERFKQVAAEDMQPVTENGRAQPTTPDVSNTVAYPLKRYESAIGTNKETRAKMTVADYQYEVANKLNADARVIMRNLLSSMLDNVSWTYKDEEGDLTIKPLANGDADLYVRRGTAVPATANNYLFQAGAISATNPFPAIWTNLAQFPNNFVSSTNPVFSFVATNLKDDIELLSALVEPAQQDVIYNATDVVNSRFDDNVPPFADEFLGIVNRCYVFTWPDLPDDYIISWATGAGAFLKMRERENMPGLMIDRHSVDGNLELEYYRRVYGFGAFNRTAANVMMVENGSYVVPTGFLASSVTGA